MAAKLAAIQERMAGEMAQDAQARAAAGAQAPSRSQIHSRLCRRKCRWSGPRRGHSTLTLTRRSPLSQEEAVPACLQPLALANLQHSATWGPGGRRRGHSHAADGG